MLRDGYYDVAQEVIDRLKKYKKAAEFIICGFTLYENNILERIESF